MVWSHFDHTTFGVKKDTKYIKVQCRWSVKVLKNVLVLLWLANEYISCVGIVAWHINYWPKSFLYSNELTKCQKLVVRVKYPFLRIRIEMSRLALVYDLRPETMRLLIMPGLWYDWVTEYEWPWIELDWIEVAVECQSSAKQRGRGVLY